MTLKIIFALFLIFSFGCAKNDGTSTGNPFVALKYQSYNAAMSIFAVNQLNFCFKRVRFKQLGEPTNSDPTIDVDNIDFEIGEKVITSIGDTLGEARVPAGQYSRVEFDLDNNCGNGYSVYINNSNGIFSTNERITIKFEGTFNLQTNTDLNLAIQPIISAINTVNNSANIKTTLEGVSGGF